MGRFICSRRTLDATSCSGRWTRSIAALRFGPFVAQERVLVLLAGHALRRTVAGQAPSKSYPSRSLLVRFGHKDRRSLFRTRRRAQLLVWSHHQPGNDSTGQEGDVRDHPHLCFGLLLRDARHHLRFDFGSCCCSVECDTGYGFALRHALAAACVCVVARHMSGGLKAMVC